MRLLFVPKRLGLSHLIPLLSLNAKLTDASIKRAFLAPYKHHAHLRAMGIDVLNIDHERTERGLRNEIAAFQQFRPDMVIDDCCFTTGIAAGIMGIPRITIQRTGMFPGMMPKSLSSKYPPSIGVGPENFHNLNLNPEQREILASYVEAKVKIVPGIRTIEVLPSDLKNNLTYHFSGPLLMGDSDLQIFGRQDLKGSNAIDIGLDESLGRFFEANKKRKIIYITFGLIAKPGGLVIDAVRYLLDNDMAVVSSLKAPDLDKKQEERYYFSNFLPMHYVCSHADLMIHHGGCATYHYPIIHNVPMITVGTVSSDREGVSLRLQELGASIHLPAPAECEEFPQKFAAAIRRYFGDSGVFMEKRKQKLRELKMEIDQTCALFNF